MRRQPEGVVTMMALIVVVVQLRRMVEDPKMKMKRLPLKVDVRKLEDQVARMEQYALSAETNGLMMTIASCKTEIETSGQVAIYSAVSASKKCRSKMTHGRKFVENQITCTVASNFQT